jgi:hypothetical protein
MDLKITRGGFFLNLHGARRPVQKGALVTVADEIGQRLVAQGRGIPVEVDQADNGEQETTVDYEALSPDQLEELRAQRGLAVTGTGKDGRVVKADLIAALKADDEA